MISPSHRAIWLIALTLGVLPPVATLERQEGAQEPQAAFGANVEMVLVDVAVLDDDGVPITDLDIEDFIVEEDGEQREVGLVMNARGAPLDVALAIDLSGSMVQTPWQQRAAEFLARLDPRNDCVYLTGFSAAPGGSIWARPDHPALIETLEISTTGGATALFDATVASANQLAAAGGLDLTGMLEAWEADLEEDDNRSGPPAPVIAGDCPVPPDPTAANDPTRRRRRALVMVTDGADSRSRYNASNARLATRAAGVPLFHVAVSGGTMAGSFRGGRGGGGSRSQQLGSSDFARIVDESGGSVVSANAEAYGALLERLRSFYVVGYYVPRRTPSASSELQEHSVSIRLPEIDGDVLYPRVGYRATIDQLRVNAEIAEAWRQLDDDNLPAAQFAADNAVGANPRDGRAREVRAEVLQRLDRAVEAYTDAILAAELRPGDAAIDLLAARLAMATDHHEVAWEYAIRAAQGGADTDAVFALFGELAPVAEMPTDFLERFDAPRVALVVGPSLEKDVFARAALNKAMVAIGGRLAEAPMLALVRDPEAAAYIVKVSDQSVEDDAPRKFRGRIYVTTVAGEEIYNDDFTLDDLDNRIRSMADLEDHARRIGERIAGQTR